MQLRCFKSFCDLVSLARKTLKFENLFSISEYYICEVVIHFNIVRFYFANARFICQV